MRIPRRQKWLSRGRERYYRKIVVEGGGKSQQVGLEGRGDR